MTDAPEGKPNQEENKSCSTKSCGIKFCSPCTLMKLVIVGVLLYSIIQYFV